MSEPITGKDAHFECDDQAGTLTDISAYITSITPSVSTEEFPSKVFKATRTTKVAGFTEESWDIVGPWTAEADAFWRPMSGTAVGKDRDYVLGPAGNTAGLKKFLGKLNVLQYEMDAVSAESLMTYTAKVSITTKTASTF